MKKFSTILIFFALILLGIAGYVKHNFMIYSSPNITLISPKAQVQPDPKRKPNPHSALQCFTLSSPVEKLNADKPLQFLVWNMHKGDDAGWQHTLQTYGKGRDMLLLQEMTPQLEQESALTQHFPTRLYVASFAYRGKSSGISALSRYAPQAYCVGAGMEPWIRIPKVGVAMFFPLQTKPNQPQQSLLVINMHLVNFELNPKHYQQQLDDMLALLKQHQGPVILAGDFNAWSKNRYQLIQKFSQRYGLQEVRFSPDYRLRFLQNPLDFVFTRGLEVLNASTVKTTSSDHNPLLFSVRVDQNFSQNSSLDHKE